MYEVVSWLLEIFSAMFPEIIGGLEKYMDENGIKDLQEIRGIVS